MTDHELPAALAAVIGDTPASRYGRCKRCGGVYDYGDGRALRLQATLYSTVRPKQTKQMQLWSSAISVCSVCAAEGIEYWKTWADQRLNPRPDGSE